VNPHDELIPRTLTISTQNPARSAINGQSARFQTPSEQFCRCSLDHPEIAADNNASERDLRPTATYRKATGGFRSDWGADLFAAVRSVIGTR
jgi:hypothetical protein